MHGCIDGYSRKITYLQCTCNSRVSENYGKDLFIITVQFVMGHAQSDQYCITIRIILYTECNIDVVTLKSTCYDSSLI